MGLIASAPALYRDYPDPMPRHRHRGPRCAHGPRHVRRGVPLRRGFFGRPRTHVLLLVAFTFCVLGDDLTISNSVANDHTAEQYGEMRDHGSDVVHVLADEDKKCLEMLRSFDCGCATEDSEVDLQGPSPSPSMKACFDQCLRTHATELKEANCSTDPEWFSAHAPHRGFPPHEPQHERSQGKHGDRRGDRNRHGEGYEQGMHTNDHEDSTFMAHDHQESGSHHGSRHGHDDEEGRHGHGHGHRLPLHTILIAAGGALLVILVVVVACVCRRRRKRRQQYQNLEVPPYHTPPAMPAPPAYFAPNPPEARTSTPQSTPQSQVPPVYSAPSPLGVRTTPQSQAGAQIV